MYLKKINIYGFKSFAEKIEINFKDGITAIVGPNGSGKSNILDAIKWVLGEQKVKSLRGQKMEDIIFSGTQIRKPLGYAEVTLTMNNSTGIFPIEYNELSVCRRLFRSGESEFYINQTRCRLKDIHDLFMDTGLGKEGYSIIGQGKIDHIVSSNPSDRRLLLEEAAGIVKYKNRKIESERKLEKTQDNLFRISDIIIELEKQLDPLHKQSEKAKTFLDIHEKLKKIELNLFLHKSDNINIELKKINEDKGILLVNLQEIDSRLKIKDETYEKLRDSISIIDGKVDEITQNILLLNHEMEENNTKIQVSLTKIEFNEKTNTNSKGEILDLKEIQEENNNRYRQIQGELIEIESNISSIKNKLQTYIEQKISYHKKQEDIAKEAMDKIQTLEEIKNNINILNNQLNIFKNKINYSNDHIISLKSRLEQIGNQKKEHENQRVSLINKKNDFHITLIKNNGLLFEEKKIYEDHKQKHNQHEKRLQIIENNYQVLLSKYRLMKDNEDIKGYYNSVRLLLKEKSTNNYLFKNLHDIVGNLIDVDKEYALAIETALGNSVQNLVTEDEYVAHECIKLLNNNKWGRATFLPLNIISGDMAKVSKDILEADGFIDIASNIVKYNDKYNKLFLNLLGKVYVVRDFDSGIKISKKTNYRYKIVTLKGEIFYPGGAMVGGGNNKNNNRNIILKKQELKDIQQEIKLLNNNIKKSKAEKETLEYNVQSSSKLVEKLNIEINELKLENNMNDNNLNQVNLQIEEDKSIIRKVNSDIENYQKDINENNSKIIDLNKEINVLQDRHRLMDDREVAIDTDNSLEEELVKLDEKIMELKVNVAKLEEKQVYLNQQEIEINNRISDYEKQLEQKSSQFNRISQENENLSMDILNLQTKLETMKNNKESLEKEQREYHLNKSKMNATIDEIQREIKSLNNEHVVINDAINKLDLRLNNIEYQLKSLQENIYENYGVNYIMATDYRYNINNMQDEIKLSKNLKDKLKSLGSVNIDSIEQYKEVKERYEFLSDQKDDLTKSREELLNIIQEIALNMEQQFINNFHLIQKGFNNTFKKLFNGGSARLLLEDNENIMDTGIEIEAQPPGKKLKNISLLSGGEKSLTAIALLFAIISIKPTPFCVLDEIDAALDDSNVDRFSKFLAIVSKENQFITITHRKGTMEIADRMYGVSMGNDGVSKVISVELTDILEDEVQ